MTIRKCSTCKHYEPAPIWRKGWCRNPFLYSPQQSHLVGEDDLDCERGMGNYWEPLDVGAALEPPDDLTAPRVHSAPLVLYPRGSDALMSQSGHPIYPVSGSSGYGVEPPDDDLPPAGADRPGPPSDRERNLDYYSDDRYWTDYVRIALPILGVGLLLILGYLWVASFLNGDGDAEDVAGASSTPPFGLITASPTTATTDVPGSPVVVQTAGPEGTQTGVAGTNQETPPGQTAGGEIAPDSMVVVTNTGGTGVNLRAEPSTEADVVAVLLDGTELTVTGESVEAEGYVWWPVSGEAGDGYIAADFLEPAQ